MNSKPITVRIPDDIMAKLPAPSLAGERSQFIIAAIKEKLDRDLSKNE